MRVPDHAAINETVSATSDLKQRWARGLVNAVLRNFQRQADTLQANLDSASLASRASHPDWLVEAVTTDWPDQLEDILDASNDRPPLTLRVNLARQSREQYLQKLSSLGIQATPGLLALLQRCLGLRVRGKPAKGSSLPSLVPILGKPILGKPILGQLASPPGAVLGKPI